MTRCLHCRRVLTDPASIAEGMGPDCAGLDVKQLGLFAREPAPCVPAADCDVCGEPGEHPTCEAVRGAFARLWGAVDRSEKPAMMRTFLASGMARGLNLRWNPRSKKK